MPATRLATTEESVRQIIKRFEELQALPAHKRPTKLEAMQRIADELMCSFSKVNAIVYRVGTYGEIRAELERRKN